MRQSEPQEPQEPQEPVEDISGNGDSVSGSLAPEDMPSEQEEERPPLIPAFLRAEGSTAEGEGDGVAQPAVDAGVAAEAAATEAAATEAAGEEKFSFMRDAERRAFWRKPLVRAGLSLAVGLGLLALAGQWAYHQRASLYARIPLARLVLDAACRPLNCRIAPWQNIHAVEIESSEFLKNPDESYALHVALRNSSLHPVAMPALELSLLDADQQLVARRVIAVDPAVPAPPVLPARGQWNIDATVDVRLPPDLAQRDISGYRLTVFYP